MVGCPVKHIVFLVGSPVSGKSNVAEAFSGWGFKHVMTSDLLKAHDPKFNQAIGRLAPDERMLSVLSKHLKSHVGNAEMVCIDSARSKKQVIWFTENFLGARFYVLEIEVSKDTCLKRIGSAPNTERGVRSDDDKFEERYEDFLAYRIEVIDALERIGAIHRRVSGEGTREEVRRAVHRVYGEIFS